jgi:Xaa-Pro aminopeptidase
LRYDLTTEFEGYWGLGGRTVFIGTAPREVKEAYGRNLTLKAAAVDKLRAGVSCQDLFAHVKQVADDLSIPFLESAGVGHGLGAGEREAPFLNPHDATLLASGMVIALDVYTYGPALERIHSVDTYLIEKDGRRLLSGYRNWDRLYQIVGVTARHG